MAEGEEETTFPTALTRSATNEEVCVITDGTASTWFCNWQTAFAMCSFMHITSSSRARHQNRRKD